MNNFAQKDGIRFVIWTFGAIFALQAILGATRDITRLREILALGALTAVPILLILAWKGWVRAVRLERPSWRNGLALSALVILSLQCGPVAGITVIRLANLALGKL